MIVRSKSKDLIVQHVKHMDNWDYVSISMGAFDPYILFFRLLGKKTYRLWIGTDVWKTLHILHYRLRVKICNLFVSENWVVAPWLQEELESIGIKSKLLKNQFACVCGLRR